MRLTQLTEKTGNELSSMGCNYLRLLTTVHRNDKQYFLYEPTQLVEEQSATLSELLGEKNSNREVYICM